MATLTSLCNAGSLSAFTMMRVCANHRRSLTSKFTVWRSSSTPLLGMICANIALVREHLTKTHSTAVSLFLASRSAASPASPSGNSVSSLRWKRPSMVK